MNTLKSILDSDKYFEDSSEDEKSKFSGSYYANKRGSAPWENLAKLEEKGRLTFGCGYIDEEKI